MFTTPRAIPDPETRFGNNFAVSDAKSREWKTEAGLGIGHTILYCRVPGMIAGIAQEGVRTASPTVVEEKRTVRDACPRAAQSGITEGMLISHARRLCPHLITVPLEQLDARSFRSQSRILLDALADLSPIVEPVSSGNRVFGDAAYADLSAASGVRSQSEALTLTDEFAAHLTNAILNARKPVIGVGPSRLAARALAESGGLPPKRLPACDVHWIWPEDPAISARLFRLGLNTFGDVAALPESAIIYQFGPKVGPLLWRRAQGIDLTSVRALYPEPRIEVTADFSLEPLTDREQVIEAIRRLALRIADDLKRRGSHARRVFLSLSQEQENTRKWEEWVVPAPVQGDRDLLVAAQNLLRRFAIVSSVTGIKLVADDLDLPPAASGDLFEQCAQGDRRAIVATRRLLTARYGARALRVANELPVERRDQRRTRRQEARRL